MQHSAAQHPQVKIHTPMSSRASRGEAPPAAQPDIIKQPELSRCHAAEVKRQSEILFKGGNPYILLKHFRPLMPTQEDEKNIHDKLIQLDKAFAAGKEVHRDAEHLLEEITQLGFSGGSEHFKRALSIYQMEARDGIADTDIQQPKRLLESGKYDYVGCILENSTQERER